MTAFDYPTRAKIGIMLLILFALLINARLVLNSGANLLGEMGTVDRQPPSHAAASSASVAPAIPRDRAKLYEERLGPLKGTLPPGAVVGYITDKEGVYASVSDYFLVRYTLAPAIITGDLTHLIVGNFSDSSIVQRVSAPDTILCPVVFGVEVEKAYQLSNEGQLILITLPDQTLDFRGEQVEPCKSCEHLILLEDFGNGVALFQGGVR